MSMCMISLLLPSFIAALGSSIASGVVGSYIVAKRIVSISGSIAHSILGGVGISLWLQYQFHINISPLYGALVGAILVALGTGLIHFKYKEREDALIAIIWSVGMAVGILFISKLPSFNSELVNFLFGNILWITPGDLLFLGSLDAIIIGTVMVAHTRFLALCFDEQYMALNGLSVKKWYCLLLVLTAVSTVVLMYIVGTILMLSMLVLPTSIASRFSFNMRRIIITSVLLNLSISYLGIFTAYVLDLPVGPVITLLMGAVYVVSLCLKKSCSAPTPSPVNPEINTKC